MIFMKCGLLIVLVSIFCRLILDTDMVTTYNFIISIGSNVTVSSLSSTGKILTSYNCILNDSGVV